MYLERHWDWSRKYPVLRFDFSEGVLPDRALLDATLLDQLRFNHDRHGLAWEEAPVHIALARLVRNLREAAGQPVVLLLLITLEKLIGTVNNPVITEDKQHHTVFQAVLCGTY